MIARASRFAAPLVLIVGCGQPPAPDEPWVQRDPEPPTVRRTIDVDAGAVVAAARVPIDAWPAPDPYAFDPCTLPPAPDNPTCNPPGRQRLIAEIINFGESEGGGVLITIAVGLDDGVDKGWRGRLLDDRGDVVKGGELTIVKVTRRQSVAKVKLAREDIVSTSVRLEPP